MNCPYLSQFLHALRCRGERRSPDHGRAPDAPTIETIVFDFLRNHHCLREMHFHRRRKMAEHPLKIFEKIDPELLKLVQNTNSLALADGALSRKFKLLIAMALDASVGATEGVKALAEQALKAGATKEEIAETIRVAQYICGVGSVYTAARAFKDLL
jgi:alkylhydroperoxidase/carboxymuconolactone decarboxylase family protein YurZ